MPFVRLLWRQLYQNESGRHLALSNKWSTPKSKLLYAKGNRLYIVYGHKKCPISIEQLNRLPRESRLLPFVRHCKYTTFFPNIMLFVYTFNSFYHFYRLYESWKQRTLPIFEFNNECTCGIVLFYYFTFAEYSMYHVISNLKR